MSIADVPVILSTSGKGGVGKTLVAVGIANALSKYSRVGIVDLDVRSPNLTYVCGMDNKLVSDRNSRPLPAIMEFGHRKVPVFSTAMLFGDGTAITMDGESMRYLIMDMMHEVQWPELDFLIADMDPSSGDSLDAITDVMRNVSAVVVSTSDVSSINDCRRMLDACNILGIRVMGIIANMIGVECPRCGSKVECSSCGEQLSFGGPEPIFELAQEYDVDVLGALPWNPEFKFRPLVAVNGNGGRVFERLAKVIINGKPEAAHY